MERSFHYWTAMTWPVNWVWFQSYIKWDC